jgi:hypothetical protein
MTQPNAAIRLAADAREPRDLFSQTLRTVAILVGACVLFVGALSLAAVTITNRAMGSPAEVKAADVTEAKPTKPVLSSSHAAQPI